MTPLNVGADLAKLYGEDMRCPSCGAFAKSEPHPEHRWVCAVCGAPRVDMSKPPEETTVALREAKTAKGAAAMKRVQSWALGVPAGISLLLAIALAPASFVAAGVLIGVGLLLAVLSARASGHAATERKRLRNAVERAWEAAILRLADEAKTVPEIAAALHIAEGEVEATLVTRGAGVRIAPEPEKRDPTRVAEIAEEEEEELGHPGLKPGAGKDL